MKNRLALVALVSLISLSAPVLAQTQDGASQDQQMQQDGSQQDKTQPAGQ